TWAWVTLIIVLPVVGALLWLTIARASEATSTPAQRPMPQAPDDDPDFLRYLQQRNRRTGEGGPSAPQPGTGGSGITGATGNSGSSGDGRSGEPGTAAGGDEADRPSERGTDRHGPAGE